MQQRFRGIGFACKKLFKRAVMLFVGRGVENKYLKTQASTAQTMNTAACVD